MKPIKHTSEVHPKKWGSERWVCNNEEFCGKLLTIKKGGQFSMHFHRDKREVFFVLTGFLTFSYIDTATAHEFSFTLMPGNTIEIPRLCPHRLKAHEDSTVIEFSTHHEESDSYRVAPGDSQKQATASQ